MATPLVTAIFYQISSGLQKTYDAIFGAGSDDTGTAPKAVIDISGVTKFTNSSASGDAKDIVLFKFTTSDGATKFIIYDDSTGNIVSSN